MQSIRNALLLTSLLLAVSAQPDCTEDPCYVEAKLPASCCVLTVPAVTALAGNNNITMPSAGSALEAYVRTACSSECSAAFLGDYLSCLERSPIDQDLVNDFVPRGLCELTCLLDQGVRLAALDDCDEVEGVSEDCKDSVRSISGVLGASLGSIFDRCDAKSPAPAPAPAIRAAAGPNPPARPPVPTPAYAGSTGGTTSTTTTVNNNGVASTKTTAHFLAGVLGAVFLSALLL